MRIINPGSNYFSENKSFNGKKDYGEDKRRENRNGIPVGKKTYISNKIAASWEKETISGFIIRYPPIGLILTHISEFP